MRFALMTDMSAIKSYYVKDKTAYGYHDDNPYIYHHAFSSPNFLYTLALRDDLHRAKQKEAGLLYVKIYDLVLLMRHKSTKISTNKTMP